MWLLLLAEVKMKGSNLKGVLLLSSFEGDMQDEAGFPNLFLGSVIYIYADDERGVRGVVLNKPFLSEAKVIFSGLDVLMDKKQEEKFNSELFLGGSSSLSRISVLYADGPEGNLRFSVAKKTVETCLLDSYNLDHLFLVGESSWLPGEIYPEIASGWWHIVPASSHIIFDGDVDSMYSRALQSISPSSSPVVMAPFHGRA